MQVAGPLWRPEVGFAWSPKALKPVTCRCERVSTPGLRSQAVLPAATPAKAGSPDRTRLIQLGRLLGYRPLPVFTGYTESTELSLSPVTCSPDGVLRLGGGLLALPVGENQGQASL